ncbi:EAL domain-containing protein [Actinoplanes sp. N902-109]|uniref:sensor domain-containing phosphodiesterase n=1 Tax=Actinoplanes sp. (strain N902-109) TaxID=649831 RepID=UPI00032957A4|nr:EAL domain-containing protein [Actinoplanes sp. N902-109]AGL18496.1 PAS/PAC and GAF sensor-containing diguanylate cyclase/phosphodiesterase [Actinoplanes sp. N902-109]
MRDIHEVVDARAVTPVFQPLIELATGATVGYEALSRGPAGTRWESPMALFAAARAAGRDAELDWVCRAAAYRAALTAGFDVTLFVNMEPATWRAPCPPDLAPVVAHAEQRLRIVTEMTERAIAADPSALLAATAANRAAGLGVALDDVGSDPMSLALMPFVHPDVVKLDMGLLHSPEDPYTAHVVAAVAAYAEATGATVLAEGVETAEHERTARTMGASIGQGYRYGRPAPALHPALPWAPVIPPPAIVDGTPYEIISAHRPVVETTKAALMPVSRHLEALAGEGEVLLACFQDAHHFTAATAGRYTRIARTSPMVAALAVGLADEPAPGVRGAALHPSDPLRGEWNVLVVGPYHAAALVARDLGDAGPESDRRFAFAVTHNRDLVVTAARSLLSWVTPVPPRAVVATGRTMQRH